MVKKAFLIFFLLFIGLIGYFWLGTRPLRKNEEKVFVINRGESAITIANRLESQGLIRNKLSFLILLKLKGVSNQIQAGSFRLSKNNSLSEIIDRLQQGRVDVRVTLVEGLRKEEIAVKLSQETPLSQEEILALVKDKEGYLFPDTYIFPENISAGDLVSLLLNNFEKKWQLVETEAEKKNLTKKQVIILASLVEREAKIGKDRPVIAGILIKRWRAGWPLQVDATVQYAKANRDCFLAKKIVKECNWWPEVNRQDLIKIKSSYNTYLSKGLPPGPICNPSLEAIQAVVNYQLSDYWFYLSDFSGKMHFAKTSQEHQDNINNYLSP